jgi:hypothetical protein
MVDGLIQDVDIALATRKMPDSQRTQLYELRAKFVERRVIFLQYQSLAV